MAALREMTVAEQFKAHTGPGSEGLPGYVVLNPGGPWYRERKGEMASRRKQQCLVLKRGRALLQIIKDCGVNARKS